MTNLFNQPNTLFNPTVNSFNINVAPSPYFSSPFSTLNQVLSDNKGKADVDQNLNQDLNNNFINPSPIVYTNVDSDKSKILSDNKGKTGIYQWEHKELGKIYIGGAPCI